jgi:hypothetical protein
VKATCSTNCVPHTARVRFSAESLCRAVTSSAARMLRQPGAGELHAGARADLTIVRRIDDDPYESLVPAKRADVRLTMIDGAPLFADTSWSRHLRPGAPLFATCALTVRHGSSRAGCQPRVESWRQRTGPRDGGLMVGVARQGVVSRASGRAGCIRCRSSH